MESCARYEELTLAREEMMKQDELYQPSLFWDAASAAIVEQLETQGVEQFRSLSKPLSYFVPTYGEPGNSLGKGAAADLLAHYAGARPDAGKGAQTLSHLLSGEAAALADYRVLLAADDTSRKPFLHRFSECSFGNPVEQFEFEGRRFSRSSLNYLLGLAFLKKHLPDADEIRTVLEVGGGFGTLGEVLAAADVEGMRYVDLDIPPTSFVAEQYLRAALGGEQVKGFAEAREQEMIELDTLPLASVLCAWQVERLQGAVDLFVNFISFQEMEPAIVQNYLHHVARLKTRYVLLRNLREGKQLKKPGALSGVETPILGGDYDVFLPDYELVATNVWPFGYQTIDGFHSELRLYRRR
jgi:putative sugar O-methyltransferase